MIHDKKLAKNILNDYQAAMRMMLELKTFGCMFDYLETCDMFCGICYYANKRYNVNIYQDMMEVNLGMFPGYANNKIELVEFLQSRIDFLTTQI